MHRLILLLSFIGILFLTACGSTNVYVLNDQSRRIGEIVTSDERTYQILNMHNEQRARVRGNVIRDDDGKRIGAVLEKDGAILVINEKNEEVGTVENGTNCYGKGNEMLGSVSNPVAKEAVGAACLVFFLQ